VASFLFLPHFWSFAYFIWFLLLSLLFKCLLFLFFSKEETVWIRFHWFLFFLQRIKQIKIHCDETKNYKKILKEVLNIKTYDNEERDVFKRLFVARTQMMIVWDSQTLIMVRGRERVCVYVYVWKKKRLQIPIGTDRVEENVTLFSFLFLRLLLLQSSDQHINRMKCHHSVCHVYKYIYYDLLWKQSKHKCF